MVRRYIYVTMMARELIHQDEFARIYWDAKLGMVELDARGDPTSAQYRTIMDRLLQIVKEKNASKLLGDCGNVGAVSFEDLLWTETDWSTRLAKTKMKYVAIIMPKSLGLHMAIDKMSDKVDGKTVGQVRKFFADTDSARKWLVSQ